MAVLARREAIVADDVKILNRVGEPERRFEVGTGRTGLHTLTTLGGLSSCLGKTSSRASRNYSIEKKKVVDPRSRRDSLFEAVNLGFCNMPAPVDASGSKKRKSIKNAGAPSKRRAVAEDDFADTLSTIQELEAQIGESRKHYNNIATLISMLNVNGSAKNPELAAAVSLCRVFSRLIAAGDLRESSRAAENEQIITAWLKERCSEYQQALVSIIREADTTSQVTALALGMRMIKERITHIPGDEDIIWSTFFQEIIEAIINARDAPDLQTEFVNKFMKEYEDVRFHAFAQIT